MVSPGSLPNLNVSTSCDSGGGGGGGSVYKPSTDVYIVQGEIQTLLAAMKRGITRFSTHHHHSTSQHLVGGQHGYSDDQHTLITNLVQLNQKLNSVSSLAALHPMAFLNPFLDVIRAEFTSGPVTSAALHSLCKMLTFGLVISSSKDVSSVVENIADAVTHARFVGTEPGADEVVLMRILHVLRTLILSSVGIYLTNESVCEIMQSCFRVCFEVRLSELLRTNAEQTLTDIMQLLFSRIPEFVENEKVSVNLRRLNMRAGGVESSMGRSGRKKRGSRAKGGHHKESAGGRAAEKKETQHTVDVKDGGAVPLENVEVENKTHTTTRSSEDADISDDTTKFDELSGHEHGNSTVADEGEKEKVEDSVESREGEEIEESVREDVEESVAVHVLSDGGGVERGDVMLEVHPPLEAVATNTESGDQDGDLNETGEDEKIKDEVTSEERSKDLTVKEGDSSIKEDPVVSEYVNDKGIRFIPSDVVESTKVGGSEGGDQSHQVLIPHGLPCVREVMRFLISLINPIDKGNTEVMISIGLSLITIGLEAGADGIGKFSSLLSLARDDLCKNLFLLMQTDRITLFAATLRVCFLLFESMRTHLKFQMESYLQRLMSIIKQEGGRMISFEHREISLESIVQLWKIPGLVTELYLNYDCDLYCSNLFEDVTKLLSENSFPVAELYNTHILSLDALLAVIDTIDGHCKSRMVTCEQYEDNMSAAPSNIRLSGLERAQSPSIRPNRMKPCENLPSSELLAWKKKRKAVLIHAADLFNQKPNKGIEYLYEQGIFNRDVESEVGSNVEVIQFLRENPRLDKRMIGDYISNRKNLKVLNTFVKSFPFEHLRVDEALRMYLETFRLPGEAPLISLLLESFATHWHKSNGEVFANDDAAFTLAYAVIMLNVDQHNYVAKKQNPPMTVEDFKKNLKGTNGASDFDEEMLEEIYYCVRSEEIVMPAEQTGLVRENYLWKVLLRRGSSKEGTFVHAPSGSYDKDLFGLTWGLTVAALSFIFGKSADRDILEKAMRGFEKCASVAAHYGMTDVFDKLIISLCKFSHLLSSGENQNAIDICYLFGSSVKAQMAAKTMFSLSYRHGDMLREGWKNLLDCILTLYRARLLPEFFTEVEDFLSPNGKIQLIKEEAPMQKSDSGFVKSFFDFMTLSQETHVRKVSPEEQQAINMCNSCISECHLEQLFLDCKFLQLEALHELVKSLILACQTYAEKEEVYSEDAAVFNLELLVRVSLQNRDRIITIWPLVKEFLYELTVFAGEYSFLVERASLGLIRLAVRLLRREEMGGQVVASLNTLLLIRPSVMLCTCRQLCYGLHELLRTNAANIHSRQDWAIIFTLLECAGAGCGAPHSILRGSRVARVEEEVVGGAQSDTDMPTGHTDPGEGPRDRGYTSDSELYTSKHALTDSAKSTGGLDAVEVQSTTSNGSDSEWQMVNIEKNKREAEQTKRKHLSSSEQQFNQYTICLREQLLFHDRASYKKACETLAFLVRDTAHITPDNFESCIHAIRVFVEAGLHGGQVKHGPHLTPNSRKTAGKSSSRKQQHMKRSKSQPMNMSEASGKAGRRGSTSDDDEQDGGGGESVHHDYYQLSLQLLDLMHTLHTRAASIYQAWSEEPGHGVPADVSSLWQACWCPLLQGMARLCCDRRRQVRTSAVTYLQKALLVHDLQRLSPAEWEDCFNKVLFPLLSLLLEEVCAQDVCGVEETRMRVATLLSKVFLQHLIPLLSLATFPALWLTILDVMDRYLKADQAGILREAIPEAVKNMLLVMDTAAGDRLFSQGGGAAASSFFTLTWERLDLFLPNLRQEVVKDGYMASRADEQAPTAKGESGGVVEGEGGEVRVEGGVAEGEARVEGGAVVEAGVRVEVADASSPPFSMSRRPGHELVRPVSPFTMDDDDDDDGEGGSRRHPSIILQPPCEDHHHHTSSPGHSPTHSPIVILTQAERVQPSSQGSDMHQPIPILVDPTILGHPEQTSTSSQPDTTDNNNRRQ